MLGFVLVLTIRLTAPLTIVRWPLWGGLASIVADTIDILIFQLAGFPSFIGYHELDKLLDMYYLTIEVIVVQGWPSLPRVIASALFGYRLAGVSLFEVTDNRLMLFVFPNLFELFFLFYAYLRRYRPTYVLTEGAATMSLAVLLAPKMAQEYVLHYGKLLDNLVAVDIIRNVITAVVAWLRGLSPA
jgi:hypothetical protein